LSKEPRQVRLVNCHLITPKDDETQFCPQEFSLISPKAFFLPKLEPFFAVSSDFALGYGSASANRPGENPTKPFFLLHHFRVAK
jgi:hypothetical protein